MPVVEAGIYAKGKMTTVHEHEYMYFVLLLPGVLCAGPLCPLLGASAEGMR